MPQTASDDGDPFDVLVLGPALPGGEVVRGVIVGLMFMDDEKGLDSKVVLSPIDGAGRPLHQLADQDRDTFGEYVHSVARELTVISSVGRPATPLLSVSGVCVVQSVPPSAD